MTVNDFLAYLEQYQLWVAAGLLAIPVLCALLNQTQQKATERTGIHYIYSAAVFSTSIPGLFSAIILFYSLFFAKVNLLEVNMVLYFLPLITMVATLLVVKRRVGFDILPGFDRLAGLMILLGLTCLVLFLLYRLRFVIGFFGSMEQLLIFGAVIYGLVKYAMAKLKGPDGR